MANLPKRPFPARHEHERVRRSGLLCALTLAGSLSCGGNDSAQPTSFAVVLAELSLVMETAQRPDGSTEVVGLDLDGRTDDGSHPEGCGKRDAVSPDGSPGVDNEFAALGALLAGFGGSPNALIQGSINEGTLLILLEFDEVQDPMNDRHIVVRLLLGTAPTDVGTDGLLVPGQSFDIRPGSTVVETRGSIVNGRVEASGLDFLLPVSILQGMFDLPLRRGRLSAEIDPDTGEVRGVMGVGIPLDAISVALDEIDGANPVLVTLANRTVRGSADLRSEGAAPGGPCDMLSAAVEIHGVHAFVLRDDL